jgi:hypothetical protein
MTDAEALLPDHRTAPPVPAVAVAELLEAVGELFETGIEGDRQQHVSERAHWLRGVLAATITRPLTADELRLAAQVIHDEIEQPDHLWRPAAEPGHEQPGPEEAPAR